MHANTFTLPWDTGEGNTLPVVVRELVGDGAGPTLVLIAGEHGIELNGPAGVDAVCRELETQAFCGTVLAIPAIAPPNLSYRHHTFGQPRGQGYTYEMPYNSYARWPGTREGAPADRLCALVWDEVISRADVVLNFHCWQRNSASCYFATDTVEGMAELAVNFGLPFYDLRYPLDEHTLHGALLLQGKRAALIELQGQWWIDPMSFNRARQGIFNTMATLGMIDRPIVRAPRQFHVSEQEAIVRAPEAGLFVPLCEVECAVGAGDLLGYLLNLDTGQRTDIVSPIAGATWLVARSGAHSDVILEDLSAYADPGDMLALVKAVIP